MSAFAKRFKIVTYWYTEENEKNFFDNFAPFFNIMARSGVEGNRLEVKTKDTKKIRGQGRPRGLHLWL